MSDKVIICPICDQSEFNEQNGKYKCKFCEAVWERTLDDNTIIDLRQAHNCHRLYNFEKAEMLYEDICKESDDENVKIMCNYGALLALFGVKFIKDKENNIITTLAHYQKQYKSIKETNYYKEIINSNYKYDYVDKLNAIEDEYIRLQRELKEKPVYDVFICCKVTPLNCKDVKERTKDHEVAKELYKKLKVNHTVFYSEVDLSGVKYDAQIYSALIKSRTILVISSSKEYLESSWVQSEWRRWLSFMDENVGLKTEKSLFMYKIGDYPLPAGLNKANVIFSESSLLDSIDNYLYTVKDNEIKKEINKAKTYLKRAKYEEAYQILDSLTNEYPYDYRPWTELIDLLLYQGINKADSRYDMFLQEALSRAKGNEINKIKQRYESLLVDKDDKKDVSLDIVGELSKANKKVIFKKYQEAETIYINLCEECDDYRPWKGLFDLLILQGVDKKDERYKTYYEQALSLCNDKDKKEEITNEYNELFKKEEKVKEKSSENKGTKVTENIKITEQDLIEWNRKGVDFYNKKDFKQAVYWYTKAAEQGNANAQCNLGVLYDKGEGVSQDYKQAVYWYTKAAEQGNANAQCNLGLRYYNGEGVSQDYKQAVYWYTKATEQGDAYAQYNLGCCYYNGEGVLQDYKQAVYWYTKAAEQGDAYAQFNLGVCYKKGEGVSQDYKQAVYWYTKAAEQGDADAQCCLGQCYYFGKGVLQDYKQAVYWYTKAAEQGDADAQCCLGQCYYFGKGVSQDYKQAVYWYTKAAEQGDADAQSNLGYCYYKGEGVKENYKQAVYWCTKAAEQGNARAQYNLGYCYDKGFGVKKDYKKAVYWYTKAAEQGNARAQCNLGYCYDEGFGVKKDYKKAVYWYTKAAEQGNANAQYNLGVCYENGEGVTKDKKQAVYWYKKAAEQGFADAKKALVALKK